MTAALNELTDLVGRWVGEGQGQWPADPPLRYGEEVVFAATGKPFLAYRQRTWALTDGRGLHAETGYLRATSAGEVELVVVQPTGFAEIHVGRRVHAELDLRLLHLSRTPTAAPVTDVHRHFTITANTLAYRLSIAMNGEPLADHLQAQLHREVEPAAADG